MVRTAGGPAVHRGHGPQSEVPHGRTAVHVAGLNGVPTRHVRWVARRFDQEIADELSPGDDRIRPLTFGRGRYALPPGNGQGTACSLVKWCRSLQSNPNQGPRLGIETTAPTSVGGLLD